MHIEITHISQQFSDLPLPIYQTSGSAGMDICAAVAESIIVKSGGISIIPTNLAIALLQGYECQVRSRSGLAAKHGIFALNAPGTIDSDYRGEICVILANFGKSDFTINRGDRIAQLVIAKYEQIEWRIVDKLSETARGTGGFGSTGK